MACHRKLPCKTTYFYNICYIAISCLLFGTVQGQSKLNVARLLLPVASTAVTNFTLEVSDGCYQWTSTRPEVANVEPIYDGGDHYGLCSTKAVVAAQWRGAKRATTIVWADDGKIRLRCDVIVDVIESVQIVTTTRELFLEDAPDALEVTVQNSQSDTFSTLDGVEFEWRLITDDDSKLTDGSTIDAHQVLRFVKWDDTAYETPRAIAPLEHDGKQGYTVLVEGIQTGSANVSVKPKHPSLADVKADIIRLIVVANLQLKPGDVYIVPYGVVKYSVDQIRQGKAEPVTLPSQRMRLQLQDETLCALNNLTSSLYCRAPGTNTVTLRDTNIRVKPDSYTPPTSNIYIVRPAYLAIMITPGRMPVLELYREYTLEVQIFDGDSNMIYATDNLLVDVQIESTPHLKLVKKLSSTTFRIEPLKVGKVRVTGIFTGVVDDKGNKRLLTSPLQRDVMIDIFEPMSIDPEVVIFPYDSASRAEYAVTFKVSGGSGDFSFSSLNTSVARVLKNEYGIAVAGTVIGNATIRAVDLKNMIHVVNGVIHVLPVDSIKLQHTFVEQEVGQILELPVGLFGMFPDGERVRFTDCRQVPLDLSFSEPNIFVEYTPSAAAATLTNGTLTSPIDKQTSVGCATIRLRPVMIGSTVLTVSYHNGKKYLSDSITIASYPALRIIYPVQPPLVTPGSSVAVLLEGGPLPWVLSAETFTRQFQALAMTGDEAGAAGREKTLSVLYAVEEMEKRGERTKQHAFRVYCTSYGQQTAMFVVTNAPSESNRHPRQVSKQIKIRCEWPVTLQLKPRFAQLLDSSSFDGTSLSGSSGATARQQAERPRDLPACPLSDDGRRAVPIPTQGRIDILVDALDKHGKSFNNFSSLDVKWSLSDTAFASFVSTASSFDQVILRPTALTTTTTTTSADAVSGPVWIEAVKHLRLLGQAGDVWLKAISDSLNSDYLKNAHSHIIARHKPDGSNDPTTVLRDALHLQLVPEPSLIPKALTIYNYETNHQQLTVSGGSGFFYLQVSRPQLIRAAYDETKRTIVIAPHHEGVVELRAYDLCLYTWRPAVAHIDVVDVARVEVVALDRVELGKSVPLRVKMYDAGGNVLPIRRYSKWAQLQSVTQPEGVVNLQENATSAATTISSVDDDGLIYVIHGNRLGRTRIHFETRKRGATAAAASDTATTISGGGSVVASNFIAFQVFAPLVLDPKNLTLVKSSDFQMAYSGGPQPSSDVKFMLGTPTTTVTSTTKSGAVVAGGNVKYRTPSTQTASIDDTGTLRALDYGRVNVVAQLDAVEPVTGKRIVLTRDEAEVHIVKLTGIKIFAPLSTIEVGHEMPLFVEGLARGISGQIMALSFAGTRAPHSLTFTWRVDNKEIADIHGVLHRNGITLPNDADASMRFYATSAGHANVRVFVRDATGVVLGAAELTDQVIIRIVEPLFVRSRVNNEFLMTPNSRLALYSSRDGQARMLYDAVKSSDLVGIDGRGHVSSQDATGVALVEVVAQESAAVASSMNRSFTATVAVRDVAYLTISVDAKWLAKSDAAPLRAVPLGATFLIHVAQHDIYGRKFDSENIALRFRPNLFNLLPISYGANNGTLVAKASKVGRTIVKVWDEARPHLVDFINVVVESAISPSDGVFTIGDVICFQCRLMSPSSVAQSCAESNLALMSPFVAQQQCAAATSSGAAKQTSMADDAGGKWSIFAAPASAQQQSSQHVGYDSLVLNADSGIAVAVRPGASTITYSLPSSRSKSISTISATTMAKADVTIVPLSSIKFVAMSRLGLPLALRNINTRRTISTVPHKLGRVFLPLSFNGAGVDGVKSDDESVVGMKAVKSAELLENCINSGILSTSTLSRAEKNMSPLSLRMPSMIDKLAGEMFACLVEFSASAAPANQQQQIIKASDFFDVRPVFMPESLMFGCLVQHKSFSGNDDAASQALLSMDVLQVISALEPTVVVRAAALLSTSSAAAPASSSYLGGASSTRIDGDAAQLQFLPHFMPTQREVIIMASETLQANIDMYTTRAVADNIEIRLDTGGGGAGGAAVATSDGPKTAADNAIQVSAPISYQPGKYSFPIRIRDVTSLYESGYVAASTGTISVRLVVSCQATGQEEHVTLKLKLDDLTLEQLVARQRSWLSYITPAASTVAWSTGLGFVIILLCIIAAILANWQNGMQRQAFEWGALLRGAGAVQQPAPAAAAFNNTTPQNDSYWGGQITGGTPRNLFNVNNSNSAERLLKNNYAGGNLGPDAYGSFYSNISSPQAAANGLYSSLLPSKIYTGNSASLADRLLNSSLHSSDSRSGANSAASSSGMQRGMSIDASLPAHEPLVPSFMAASSSSQQQQMQHRTTPGQFSRYREHSASGGSDDEMVDGRPFDSYSTTSTNTTTTVMNNVPQRSIGIGREALRARKPPPLNNNYETTWSQRIRR